VSMTLIWLPSQKLVTAAEVMVIPRSFSWAIQWVVAAPSWVSPGLWFTPVSNRLRSVVVVLPASIWAIMRVLGTFVRLVSTSCWGPVSLFGVADLHETPIHS